LATAPALQCTKTNDESSDIRRARLRRRKLRVKVEAGPKFSWAGLEVVHGQIKDRDRCYVEGADTSG
jgi:hypothetical protein